MDRCPQCEERRTLRFGLWPSGTLKIRCTWCGWHNADGWRLADRIAEEVKDR